MIAVQDVTKVYGRGESAFKALDNVSFSIENGDSVAVVGKSGSGKSTLMHIVSGLDRPDSGRIVIDNEDMLTLKPRAIDAFRAKKMGFVFQSFFVEGGETCYDNVSLSLEMAEVPRSRRKKRITEALEAVDLQNKIYEKAKNLSGGQKQRLAIARAIVGQPEILFADEPTGNLDSATSKVVEDLLFSYQKTKKATLIIVTHDEELAARCQKVIRIKDGQIVSADSTKRKASPVKTKTPAKKVRSI